MSEKVKIKIARNVVHLPAIALRAGTAPVSLSIFRSSALSIAQVQE